MKDICIKLLQICKDAGQRLNGRNLTTDNLYTGVELARELESKFKMTIIGTLRKNKKGIPKEMFNAAGKEPFSSEIWYEVKESNPARIHLTEYTVVNKSKGKRSIVILSTMIPYRGVTKDRRKKPAIFKLYDFTKGGVDIVDQRMAKWSTQIKCTKWTLCIFQFFLDCSRVNGCTLFSTARDENPRLADTKSYLWNLAHRLVLPWLYTRKLAPGIQKSVQRNIALTIENAKQGGIDFEAPQVGEAVPFGEAEDDIEGVYDGETEEVGEDVHDGEPEQVGEAVHDGEPEQVGEAVHDGEPEQVGEAVHDGEPEQVGEAGVEEDNVDQPGLDIQAAPQADLADNIFVGPKKVTTRKRCVSCLEESYGGGYKNKKQSLQKVNTLCQICKNISCLRHLKQACIICTKLLVKKDTSE